MLVAMGAALFVLIPLQAGMPLAEVSRVSQGIITGIGFIGAGTILQRKKQERILGLTTAAGLWFTTSVGIAAGMGREVGAILGTGLAFLILALFPRIAPTTPPTEDCTRRSWVVARGHAGSCPCDMRCAVQAAW
jgi:putative Mg2+ transporter-C (MgtC) family protein